MGKKKYNLHCFGCGMKFYNNNEVYRNSLGWPTCGECMADSVAAEHDRFLEEEWYKNHPGQDPEEEHRKEVYLAKYGEY